MKRKKRNEDGLNLPMLIVTAIVSALAWPIIYGVYSILWGNAALPVTVGVAMTLLFAVIGVVVFLLSTLQGTYRADVITGYPRKRRIPLYLVLGCVGFFAATALLQFVYQLDILPKAQPPRGDYIFVIDDSGSMSSNDPSNLRYQVLPALLEDQPDDTQYMIYSFAGDVQLVQPMKTVGEGLPQGIGGSSSGGTYIEAALRRVIDDYDSGVWKNVHDGVVILLTDGLASDIAFDSAIDPLLERYSAAGLTVSTISMGSADRGLLRRIADRTGGQFVDISDVSGLDGAYRLAAGIDGWRDLLSRRDGGWLYGLMRIAFVTVLGTLLALMAAVCYGSSPTFGFTVRVGAVKSLAAALLLELGLELLHLPEFLATWLAAVLIGTVAARYGWGREEDDRSLRTREHSRTTKKIGTTPAPDDFDDFW